MYICSINQLSSFSFSANIMYSTLGAADSEETTTTSNNSSGGQDGARGSDRTGAGRDWSQENGFVADGEAGFTQEWAQQADQRTVRRRDQVGTVSHAVGTDLRPKRFFNERIHFCVDIKDVNRCVWYNGPVVAIIFSGLL